MCAYFHALYLIATTTPNCLAHDYKAIIPVVEKMSTAGYDFTNLIADSSVGPHCLAPSLMLHFLVAHLTAWNAHAELYLGTFLIFLRCLFLADCVNSTASKWLKLTFFSVLLALNFGTGCCSIFLFGNPCMAVGIGLLCFSAGLWSIVKLNENSIVSKIIVLLCGSTNACFGSLPALMTWGLYLLASLLLRIRSKLHYLSLVVGALVSVGLIYTMPKSQYIVPMQLRPTVFVNILGRCFANNIGNSGLPMRQSETVGYLGFAFLVILSIAFWKNKTKHADVIVPLSLVIYGALGAFAISVNRTFIASFYSEFAVLFWSGILGAALVLVFSRPRSNKNSVIALVPLVFATVVYMQTNLHYKDKDFYRRVHSPVSESVLRHFSIAPTFAESSIFALDIGDVDQIHLMATPLLRKQWSVFAQRQLWQLQGDYLLPTVAIKECRGKPMTLWIEGRDARQIRDFRDPEHLNLCLSDGNSVSWSVSVPEHIDNMVLETAVATEVNSVLKKDEFDFCSITVYQCDKSGNYISKLLEKPIRISDHFTSIKLSLKEFSGRPISIVLAGTRLGCGIRTVYKNPQISLLFDDEYRSIASRVNTSETYAAVPSNTEKSKFFPKFTASDLVYIPNQKKNWQTKGLLLAEEKEDNTQTFIATGTKMPVIDINVGDWSRLPPVFPRLGDYSNICIELAKPASHSYRIVCLQLLFSDGGTARVIMPIYKDGGYHSYNYETRLFGVDPNLQISGIQIFPTYLEKSGTLKIRSLRLVKKK